jgi:hypothetical protein
MSSATPFNALGGYSVGIPPEVVIDDTGNVVNNVNAPNSNVTANRVFANAYFYANGSPLSIGASGSNTQVQYNNNGLLGASSAFTFNSSTNLLTVTNLQVGNRANLGNVSNVAILGGTNGYFLQTDGAGNLTWAPAGNGGNTGNGIPGGANTQVQFNDAGQFGGDAGFTYNKVSNTLSIANTIAAGNAITGVNLSVTDATIYNTLSVTDVIASNITLSANITNANWINASYFAGNGHNLFGLVGANVTGQVSFANVANNVAGANVSGQVGFANVANNVAGANVSGQVANALVAGTVYTSAQPNITSVGNLTSLTVVGNTTLGNQVVSNYFIGNLFGTANLARNVTLASQPNITSVGTLTSLTVSGTTTLGNSVTSNYFIGNLYGVANSATIANTANVATFANTANLANAANLAGTVTVNAQPNITSLGTLSSLNVSGNVTAANFIGNFVGDISNANYANFAGTIVNSAQPNITSVGTLTGLTIAGNLSATRIAGPLTTNVQPNITSVGTLTALTVNGVTSLGPIGNVKITGGTNGYVLSTDGIGNLSWVAQSGNGGGNGSPAGSNTQLQFNDAGSFGASPNLAFNSATNFLLVGGNATVTNTITTNTLNSNVINATNVAISSNLTVPTINSNSITAGNITGTLTTNSQPNINYLGSLGWLNVDTDLPNSNGNITFNGSISGVGAASQITITGNINAGNYVEANYFVGEIATNNQPYITNVGSLTSLTVVGDSNLGNAGNVKILGGTANYVLSTDGAGNLSWVSQVGGNTSPGGLNTYIQFNDNGVFGGDNTLTWNKNTDTLFVGGSANISGVARADIFNATAPQGTSPLEVISTTPVANLGVQTADTVRNAAQPNITSVGTLSSLAVSGNTSTSNLNVINTFNAGNITTPGTIGTTNLNVTGNGNISGNTVVSGSGTLSINGKFNSAGSSNVNLGNIANIHISGGINGYVLATDGNANLFWTAGGGGGGNGTPGGSNTQIQYNNAGTFGGSPAFTIDAPNANVRLAGNLTTNSFTIGSGVYEFSRSNVFFATTIDTSTQTLLAIPANDIAAVDYTIISTDGIIRNFIKISAVVSNGVLNYVEYSTLPVNGYTGDFVVSYDSGNIITPPTIQLTMTPQSANLMTHKMSVTTYKE